MSEVMGERVPEGGGGDGGGFWIYCRLLRVLVGRP